MPVCRRCRKETNITTMSWFNEDEICMECDEREQEHPDFKKAKDAERKALVGGNPNFPGIGKPADL